MSIAAEVGKKLTWEDIFGLGEQKIELVGGGLNLSPTPNFYHQHIGTNLTLEIAPFVRQAALGTFPGRDMHDFFDKHNHF